MVAVSLETKDQVGRVLARLSFPESQDKEKVFFVSIDKVKFRRPVVPGDQILFELTALRTGSRIWKMGGKAFVDKSLVAEAELVASIG